MRGLSESSKVWERSMVKDGGEEEESREEAVLAHNVWCSKEF